MIIIIYIVLHILFYKIYTIYSDLSLLRPYTSNVLFWPKNKTKQKTKKKTKKKKPTLGKLNESYFTFNQAAR